MLLSREMSAQSQTIVTRRQVIFWTASSCVLFVVALLWTQPSLYHRSSDSPVCLLHQRNLQQAVRAHQRMKSLKPGDPLDWSKIIGAGQFLETKPTCPVHGDYIYSPVIPEKGTLAAPCTDPEHRPADTKDW